MRNMRKTILASGLLAFVSQTSAQIASVCPTNDVCFGLNIPEATASSGNGDIFFQISAPSDYGWVALGQGVQMGGSNMFVVYTSGDGNNVTLSPRTTSGHSPPDFNSDAQVTLLEGSGVTNGKMVANVRCSNCNAWADSSADFKVDKGDWIYAYQPSGGPKNSDDQSANINQHESAEAFSWSYASAKGGNSVNPLLNAAPSGSGSGGGSATGCVPRPTGAAATATATETDKSDDDDVSSTQQGRPTNFPYDQRPSWATASPTGRPWAPPNKNRRQEKRQEIKYCDEVSTAQFRPSGASSHQKMVVAHGILAALAFVILFPAGAIAIRLGSFRGAIWFHAAFQGFAFVVYIIAFGLGAYLANELSLLDSSHPSIGIAVFVLLIFQPILGFLHHSFFKKYHRRTVWSHAHLWLGRFVITLGIVNGGLGFDLAEERGSGSRAGKIAYAVIASIVWLGWVVAAVIGERRRTRTQNHPPKYSESPYGEETVLSEIPHPQNGHYGPK
ncbi:hypothetical protein BDV95DRAFT_260925 [Massariosphaeria phaeospora]|uniref:Cytochrome b561 domain-containing protein n=1 Tax=Massariosphaeria phaeospora TaxID=100035 RepID=A0A7C8M495_9PLEO|nr:hypothetical protein BDV95DRAFT_260925 [Massariosphaeria phaeospora]